jgi:arylformamidase
VPILASGTALVAGPALADECRIGPPAPPEFQRQNRDFAAAVKAAGKPVELIEAANYSHLEMNESLASPYAPNGRAALAMMKLSIG